MTISKTWRTLVAAAALTFGLAAAQAAAPQLKTQVPGWYRTMVGDFEVTALYDGYIDIDPKQLLRHAHPGEIESGMARAFQPGPKVQTSVNAFLVNTGAQLILVDTGARGFAPTVGQLQQNLQAAGYQPAQVDLVLLTHLHGDHVNGLVGADGQPAFPNAQVMASAPEAGFWLDDAAKAKAPKQMQGFFDKARAALAPVQAAGRFKTFEPNAVVAPGVTAVATGHTPGHSSYLLESQGQQMLLLGDIVHVGSVQFGRPEVSISFDTDNRPAIASRKLWFARAAKEKLLLGGAHLPFPGLGHVRPEGKGYAWVPVEYSPIR